jgi:hypothetical protein
VIFGEPQEYKAGMGAALRAADVFLSDYLFERYLKPAPSRRKA